MQGKGSAPALGTLQALRSLTPGGSQLLWTHTELGKSGLLWNDLGSGTDALRDSGLPPAPHSHKFLLLQALDLPAVMKKSRI